MKDFVAEYEAAKSSGDWTFLEKYDLKDLHKKMETNERYGWKVTYKKCEDTSIGRIPVYNPTAFRSALFNATPVKTYLKSVVRFKKLYPEWFAVRGDKIDKYLFENLDKFGFRKKFYKPPKMEDLYIKWLLAFQMLGCATWEDAADFSGERRKDGMCVESDFRNSMVGAGWLEAIGEEKRKYKNRPIYQITDAGADVVQYAASH